MRKIFAAISCFFSALRGGVVSVIRHETSMNNLSKMLKKTRKKMIVFWGATVYQVEKNGNKKKIGVVTDDYGYSSEPVVVAVFADKGDPCLCEADMFRNKAKKAIKLTKKRRGAKNKSGREEG
jgi:acyl-coenzyme A synthetase/AMP-(fatty) acid ligase